MFQNISRLVFANVGSAFSVKRVADYLRSQRLTITVETVQKYFGYLTKTYALVSRNWCSAWTQFSATHARGIEHSKLVEFLMD